VNHEIEWVPAAVDRLSALSQEYAEAPGLIVTAVYELASNPYPTNSTQLGTSPLRRLLLGYWRVTYEVTEAEQRIRILMVGRSRTPR
jgi:mRNA interferase RelE/StbE